MLNQWRAHRGRPHPSGLGGLVGSLPVGTVVYLQDGIRPMRAFFDIWVIRRDPWIIEAWHNREVGGSRRGPDGRYEPAALTGGHLATVRSLRTGRRTTVADWLIRASLDAGGDWYPRKVRAA
jgi:hypothetical protein